MKNKNKPADLPGNSYAEGTDYNYINTVHNNLQLRIDTVGESLMMFRGRSLSFYKFLWIVFFSVAIITLFLLYLVSLQLTK